MYLNDKWHEYMGQYNNIRRYKCDRKFHGWTEKNYLTKKQKQKKQQVEIRKNEKQEKDNFV